MEDDTRIYKDIKSQAKLKASFYGKDSRIYFSKDVLRAIKRPKHICLKINRDMTSFLIMPCDGRETMSFPVPENLFTNADTKMRISSQGFVFDLFARNGLDIEQTYRVDGVYFPKNNAVVFQMDQAALFAGHEGDTE